MALGKKWMAGVGLAAFLAGNAAAQTSDPNMDWPSYAADLAATH